MQTACGTCPLAQAFHRAHHAPVISSQNFAQLQYCKVSGFVHVMGHAVRITVPQLFFLLHSVDAEPNATRSRTHW